MSAVVVVAEKDSVPYEVLRPDHGVMSPEDLNSALIASGRSGVQAQSPYSKITIAFSGKVWCEVFEMLVLCANVEAVLVGLDEVHCVG